MGLRSEGLREVSLFTGGGGGLYASKLLGFQLLAMCEWDEYAQRVLRARIEDGTFEDVPIWDDVRTFPGHLYAGVADIVTAGFPCQPFSLAGKQRANGDARNMWPATLRAIRYIRPRYVWLENVPGLRGRSHGYLETILRGLADSGYDVVWDVFSARKSRAPHERKRLFLFCVRREDAYAYGRGREELSELHGEQRRGRAWELGDDVVRLRDPVPVEELVGAPAWEVEPGVGRVVDGMAHRGDRLRCLGNGQVPVVVFDAWHLLTERAIRAGILNPKPEDIVKILPPDTPAEIRPLRYPEKPCTILGLNKTQRESFAAQGLETLADLDAWLEAGNELTDMRGIGPKSAQPIAEVHHKLKTEKIG